MDKTFLDIIRKVILQETVYLRHYIGKVMSTDDQKGRVCVAVYELGIFTEAKGFWCWPRDKNALITPAVGDWVEVYFINGNIDKPVYLGIASEMKDMLPKNYASKNTQVIFEGNENKCAVVYDEAANELSIGKTDMQYAARKNDATIINSSTDSALFTWWTVFVGGLTVFLTGLNAGTLTAQATAFLAVVQGNPHPSSYTGKINAGSDQIKVGKK